MSTPCSNCGAPLAGPFCTSCGKTAAPAGPPQPMQGWGPQAQAPHAQPPQGWGPPQAPQGQAPYGQAPYGQAPYGQAPYGQPPPYGFPGQGPQAGMGWPAQGQGGFAALSAAPWKWGYSRWIGIHYGPIPVGAIVAIIVIILLNMVD